MSRTRKSAENDMMVLLNKVRKPKHGEFKRLTSLTYAVSSDNGLYASDGRCAIEILTSDMPLHDGHYDVRKSALWPVDRNESDNMLPFPTKSIQDMVKKARNTETHTEKTVSLSDCELMVHVHNAGLLIDWTRYGTLLQKIESMDVGLVSVFIENKSDIKTPILIRFKIPSGIDRYYGVVNLLIMPVRTKEKD